MGGYFARLLDSVSHTTIPSMNERFCAQMKPLRMPFVFIPSYLAFKYISFAANLCVHMQCAHKYGSFLFAFFLSSLLKSRCSSFFFVTSTSFSDFVRTSTQYIMHGSQHRFASLNDAKSTQS